MRQITYKDVVDAIKCIQPVPQTEDEREERIRDQLAARCGQTQGYADSTSEYDPRLRRIQFVETGI